MYRCFWIFILWGVASLPMQAQSDSLFALRGLRIDTAFSERDEIRSVRYTSLRPYLFWAPDSLIGWGEQPPAAFDSLPAGFCLFRGETLKPGRHWLLVFLRQAQPRRRTLFLSQENVNSFAFNPSPPLYRTRTAWVWDRYGWQAYQPDSSEQKRVSDELSASWQVSVPPQARVSLFFSLEKNPGGEADGLSLSRWSSQDEQASQERQDMRLGLFWGMIWLQAIYFFLFGLTTRQRDYFFYLLYVAGIAALLLVYQFGGGWEEWEAFAYLLCLGLSAYGGLRFTSGFVDMLTYLPQSRQRLRWFLRILVVCGLSLGLAWLLVRYEQETVAKYFLIFGTIGLLFCILLSIVLLPLIPWRAYRLGNPLGRYLLIAWLCLWLSVLLPVLIIVLMANEIGKDIIEVNWLLATMLGGIILQMSTIALGLGYKQRLLTEARLETERALNQELQAVNQAIRRFVPYEFLEALGKKSVTEVKLGDSAEKHLTVLFSDIRGYTTLSEKMSPQENFDFLNAYLAEVGPVLREHGGFVNQYLGDGIMGLFVQAPEQATAAALEMLKRVQVFNARREGLPPVRTGIGLHAGPLMMGIIGDGQRLDAGVVADAVNTAARMEGLTKHFGVQLLVSEAVYDQLPEAEKSFHRFLGLVQVKGREQPLRVYDFFGSDAPEVKAGKRNTLAAFNRGLQAYYRQDFSGAVLAFTTVLEGFSPDRSSQLYLEKARQYQQDGVPNGWSGVEQMMFK